MLLKLDCLKLKRSTVARIPASEILVSLGYWNGHVGADDDGFDEVPGGQGCGVRNAEVVMILEFALANDLRVGNTWFKKRDSHLITYSSGDYKTQIDYILFHKNFSKAVSNVMVIPNEECVQQHHLVVCDFSVHIPAVKKRKFTPRIRSWKLKDPATASQFHAAFRDKVAIVATNDGPPNSVEEAWTKLKDPLLKVATEVCGLSKQDQWKPET